MRHSIKPFKFIDKPAAIKAHKLVLSTFTETTMTRDKQEHPIQLHSEELMALYELAAGHHNPPNTPGIIVNIGTAKGGSACIMALALKTWGRPFGSLLTLDRFYPYQSELSEEYIQAHINIYKLKLEAYCVSIMHQSPDLFISFPGLIDPARIIFIDSAHNAEQVRCEIDAIITNITTNGFLIFHDYNLTKFADYTKAINHYFDRYSENQVTLSQLHDLLVVQFLTETRR